MIYLTPGSGIADLDEDSNTDEYFTLQGLKDGATRKKIPFDRFAAIMEDGIYSWGEIDDPKDVIVTLDELLTDAAKEHPGISADEIIFLITLEKDPDDSNSVQIKCGLASIYQIARGSAKRLH